MTIYFNDAIDYSPIIEKWVNEFRDTLEDDPANGNLKPGDDSGNTIPGIKIIFDGYGEDDDGNPDLATESYAVFIHRDSLDNEDFPEHEKTPWALVHRPKEEVCIWCWYDANTGDVDVIPFEDNNSTELDPDYITTLIFELDEKYYGPIDYDSDDPMTARQENEGWPYPTSDD
jgi:hypothetical protein